MVDRSSDGPTSRRRPASRAGRRAVAASTLAGEGRARQSAARRRYSRHTRRCAARCSRPSRGFGLRRGRSFRRVLVGSGRNGLRSLHCRPSEQHDVSRVSTPGARYRDGRELHHAEAHGAAAQRRHVQGASRRISPGARLRHTLRRTRFRVDLDLPAPKPRRVRTELCGALPPRVGTYQLASRLATAGAAGADPVNP